MAEIEDITHQQLPSRSVLAAVVALKFKICPCMISFHNIECVGLTPSFSSFLNGMEYVELLLKVQLRSFIMNNYLRTLPVDDLQKL